LAGTEDEKYMNLALREARKGLGRTSPNPCVGAVIVSGNEVVGCGYHHRAGAPHAEINAIADAGDKAAGATIYVTLEPCNHTGKTPPCTKAIVRAGLKRVVVGMIDPNPLVSGTGCDYLMSQSVAVSHGVLADKCEEINRPFRKHVVTGLPWVIMKAGCSMDGRIAVSSGKSGWITGAESRREVHRIRNRVDVIMVGIATALQDDPSLTTRLSAGQGRDPLRVVLDTSLRMRADAKMLVQDSQASTWIFCGPDHDHDRSEVLVKAGAKIIEVDLNEKGRLDLDQVLKIIGDAGFNSVLVEGGGLVHGSFLRQGLVDQVNMFMAPLFLGADGIPVVGNMFCDEIKDGRRFTMSRTRRFGQDMMIEGVFS